jgi:adenylylsulfate kinase-like enzyme
MARPQPALVVIVGPIAAGKSTLAAAVAQRLRARGEAVAVVGLDSVAEMALPTLDWEWAHEVHGQLVRAWLATPVRTVVAEGPSTAAEVDRLMRCLPRDVEVLTVVLTTRYEVALRRAQQDPDREISKDPEFLRGDHDRFESSRPHLTCDLLVDSSEPTPSTLAERVTQALDGRRSARAGDCH